MHDEDQSGALAARVNDALSTGSPLEIVGGGSKRFYGRAAEIETTPLETSGHSGVVHYAPTELVITARSGTRIRDINRLLAEHGQQLPFEPPELHGYATLAARVPPRVA